MPNIQVLDPHVADLIAAGEVVERPASVAKELMENAIDAGASSVTVEIAHGGLTFLRVTDDGKGIPSDQLRTAFLRHATSKLRTEYDLEAIGTLGIRGEALAAIAAVSRVEVMSRTADAPLGASLALEGGEPGPVEEQLGRYFTARMDFFQENPVYQPIFCEAVISPPGRLLEQIQACRKDFDALTISTLERLLRRLPLRADITMDEVVDLFRQFQDFINAQTQSTDVPAGERFARRDAQCRRLLKVLLYGVTERRS